MNASKKSIFLLVLSGLSTAACAVDVTALGASVLTPGPQGWYIDNTTGTTPASITATPTNDGDGSLHFSGTGNEKEYVTFGAYQGFNGLGNFASLGTLGQLANGSVSADLFRTSTNSTHPTLQVAVKLIFANNRQLTWESAYNDGLNVNGSWVSELMSGGGKWWTRDGNNGGNYDTYNNFQTLASWANGYTPKDGSGNDYGLAAFNANSPILGFSVGYGSGVGAFDGAIDHLTYSFAGGQTYNYNFAVQATPEPASLAALGVGLVAVLRRRKRA